MNKTKPPLPVKPAIKFLSPALKEKILCWDAIKRGIITLAKEEQELRRELASLLVPNPVEGSNRIDNAECEVQLVHKVTRKLDESALDRVMPQLPEEYRKVGTPGDLIYFKPNFDLEVYRKMSAENKKIFEQALEIKDAMPTLEIELKQPPIKEITNWGGDQMPKIEIPSSIRKGKYIASIEKALLLNRANKATSARPTKATKKKTIKRK